MHVVLRLVLLVSTLAFVTACGQEDKVEQVGVDEAVAQVERRGRVEITGTTGPGRGEWFVLNGRERSIWVLADRERVERLRPAERVTVSGTMEQLTTDEANDLAAATADLNLASAPGGGPQALGALRYTGSPFLNAAGAQDDLDAPGE